MVYAATGISKKIKVNEKRDKYLDVDRELKKAVENEINGDTKGFEKGVGRAGNWRMSRDHPIYRSARMLKIIFETWEDLLSLHHHLIILSCHQHGYPWLSFAIPRNRSSLLAGHQGYTLYPHRPAVCRFELVALLLQAGPREFITYELVPTSPAVFCWSGSSNLDIFHDGSLVAVQLLLCGVLLPGLVQYCSQHSCEVAVKLFLHPFS